MPEPKPLQLQEGSRGGPGMFYGPVEFVGGEVTNAVAEMLNIDKETCHRLKMRDVKDDAPEHLTRVAAQAKMDSPLHNPEEWTLLGCEKPQEGAAGHATISASLVMAGPKNEPWPLVNMTVPAGRYWATDGWAEAERVWVCSKPLDFLVLCDVLPRWEGVVGVNGPNIHMEDIGIPAEATAIAAICERLQERDEHPRVKIVGAVSELNESVNLSPAGRTCMAWKAARGTLKHVDITAFRPNLSEGYGFAGLHKRLGGEAMRRYLNDVIKSPKRISMIDMPPLSDAARRRAGIVYEQVKTRIIGEEFENGQK